MSSVWRLSRQLSLPRALCLCLSPQEIYDIGKNFRVEYQAIRKQAQIIKKLGGIVATKPATIVAAIEPAQQAMPMERIVKLFTTAFEQICGLKEVDKSVLSTFANFPSCQDYAPLLASYEKWALATFLSCSITIPSEL
ncbi:MAG: hypothetical protein AOA65_0956 [Candidatus Bathyarchaeota archaeon BA1]|nr:MAG: hypothetical protein AOA65_0956 [Candidatus Bathyarchaeota archaeon BA1]